MATFPTYAKVLMANFAEDAESAVMSTQMETGPAKVLKVKSRVMVSRAVQIRLASKADYLTFLTWFRTTLEYGALWFDWFDPVSETTRSARFAGGRLGQGAPSSTLAGAWVIPATIETWSA